MRVALLNLRYSPNLGDVLLCECLEYGLRQASPDIDLVQIDITGRQRFSPANPRRLAAMAVLQRLPLLARQSIARFILGRSLKRIVPLWKSQFAGIDAAVLGGGNLLADSDLNFPLKISAVLREVAQAGKPLAVYGVGVSDNWSRAGAGMFRKALSGVRLVHAAVRDIQPEAIWKRRLGPSGIAAPIIVRDPGLLAAACYANQRASPSGEQRVGICMSHPVALSYHADEQMPDAELLTSWFVSLAQTFAQQGYEVSLFTTGSPEDEMYLDRVMPRFMPANGSSGMILRVPRFDGAADLAGFVSSLSLLLGHRLHACIVAYAFAIPNIGFTWDNKMRSFFVSVARQDYIVPAVTTSVHDVVDLAHRTSREGIDLKARDAVVAETQRDIVALLQNLVAA